VTPEAARDRLRRVALAEHQGKNRSDVVTGAKVNRAHGLELVRWLVDEGRLVERTTPGGGYGLYLP
jgi:hypothetical protein